MCSEFVAFLPTGVNGEVHCYLGLRRISHQIRDDEKIWVSRGVSARGGLCEHVCEFAFAGFDWNQRGGGDGGGKSSARERV